MTIYSAGNLVVMVTGFELVGLGLIPGATKDSRNACGVRARKIRSFEFPVAGL